MRIKLTHLIIAGMFLLVFGITSTCKEVRAQAMISPGLGTPLATTTATFDWSTGSGVDIYGLGVGTSYESIANDPWGDIYADTTGTSTSAEVSGIPIDGNTLYVRLWWKSYGKWKYVDYQYQTQSPGAGGYSDCPESWSKIIDDANDRFELVMNDEAVLDHETSLVWERAPGDDQPGSLIGARDACYTSHTGNRYGWRLPAIEELSTLGVYNGANGPCDNLPCDHPFEGLVFGAESYDGYWSSTLTGYWHWGLNRYGKPARTPGSVSQWRVWCVRGGHGPSQQHSVGP